MHSSGLANATTTQLADALDLAVEYGTPHIIKVKEAATMRELSRDCATACSKAVKFIKYPASGSELSLEYILTRVFPYATSLDLSFICGFYKGWASLDLLLQQDDDPMDTTSGNESPTNSTTATLPVLPSVKAALARLQRLSLQNNCLDGMPRAKLQALLNSIANMPKLVDLNLSHNDLRIFPFSSEALQNLSRLTSLNLSGNFIKPSSIPPSISSLASLKHLSFNDMSWTDLPTELFTLSTLESLHLGGNRGITKLPADITNLCNLQELCLGRERKPGRENDGDLDSVPANLTILTSLTKLSVQNRDNISRSALDTIVSLTNLRDLNLHVRGLPSGTAPDGITQLQQLTRLALGTIPQYDTAAQTNAQQLVYQLESLRELDLSNCGLCNLLPSIQQLSQLTSLCLASNQLESVNELAALNELERLDVRGNKLRAHALDVLNGLARLRDVKQ